VTGLSTDKFLDRVGQHLIFCYKHIASGVSKRAGPRGCEVWNLISKFVFWRKEACPSFIVRNMHNADSTFVRCHKMCLVRVFVCQAPVLYRNGETKTYHQNSMMANSLAFYLSVTNATRFRRSHLDQGLKYTWSVSTCRSIRTVKDRNIGLVTMECEEKRRDQRLTTCDL